MSKITFEEVLSKKEWLHKEMLNSLTPDIIDKAIKDRYYDVKLVINGVETEPVLFNLIMNNIEKMIDEEAKALVREKLEEVDNKVRRLSELIEEVSSKITDEYNLDDNEI